jgi:hypothetical protein
MATTMPPVPANVTIPTFSAGAQTGTTQAPGTPCFYYGAVSLLWGWYEVDLDVLTGYLSALGMKPANLGGKGAVNWSFMSAASLFGVGFVNSPGGSAFEETELNVVAYAAAREADVPDDLTLEDFLMGGDQTKNLGVYRLHVACNNGVAIAMGRDCYYENKFLAQYQFVMPSLNNPVKDIISGVDKWQITGYDGQDNTAEIYGAQVNLQGVTWIGANCSEIIDLSYDQKRGRVLGSRRNFLGIHQVAFLDAGDAGRVTMSYGKPTQKMSEPGRKMQEDMSRLIGSRAPVAVQKFDSPPCIAEAVPYYMDLI